MALYMKVWTEINVHVPLFFPESWLNKSTLYHNLDLCTCMYIIQWYMY
jgi:hypothetical protein